MDLFLFLWNKEIYNFLFSPKWKAHTVFPHGLSIFMHQKFYSKNKFSKRLLRCSVRNNIVQILESKFSIKFLKITELLKDEVLIRYISIWYQESKNNYYMVFVNAFFETIDLLIYNQLIVCNCNNMFKVNLKELLENFSQWSFYYF